MLKAGVWALKLLVFSLLVLVVGNLVHWKGETLSDQVRTQVAHAERSQAAEHVRGWGNKVSESAKDWVNRGAPLLKPKTAAAPLVKPETTVKVAAEKSVAAPEHLETSERQKLRALIRELNGTRKKD